MSDFISAIQANLRRSFLSTLLQRACQDKTTLLSLLLSLLTKVTLINLVKCKPPRLQSC